MYDSFQTIGEYTSDSQHIKRRFIYAAGIDEPICMIVEPDHQGWYGLDEFSTIASSWLCETQNPCYDENAEYNADDIINLDDLSIFLSNSYYLEERPLLENPKYYGYVFDGTGSVIAMTYMNDPNQTADPNETPYFVETYTYDPFGTPSIYDADSTQLTASAIGNPYMFTAREYDPESGLYYYRYRMYSPTLGRFMQTDPIGYYDSMNPYQYCLNNPVNYIDPWGLSTSSLNPVVVIGAGLTEKDLIAMGLIAAAAAQATAQNDAGFWQRVWSSLSDPFRKSNESGSEKGCDNPSDSARDAADKMANGDNPPKGWEKRGPNWYNPDTGESLHPDNHPPFGPHVDWTKKIPGLKPEGRIFPGGRYEPK